MITPVPGGVGPMTVTMLMANLVDSWELSLQHKFVGQELSERQRFTNLRSSRAFDELNPSQTPHEYSYNFNLHKSLEKRQASPPSSSLRPQSAMHPIKVTKEAADAVKGSQD